MTIFHSMNTTASALSAQRLRMDIISCNMANVDSTRAATYRRKMAIFEPKEGQFSSYFNKAMGRTESDAAGNGVKVSRRSGNPIGKWSIIPNILMPMPRAT